MSCKSFIIVTVLAFAVFVQFTLTETKEALNILPLPDFQTKQNVPCGGIITSPIRVKDQILYKPFKPVDPNERCIWIVAVPDASTYKVKLIYGGDDIHSNLNIAGVRARINALDEQGLSTEGTSVDGSHLVITFHTGSNGTSNGFALEYYGIGNNPETNLFIFVEHDTHFLKYTVGGGQTDEEVATFVLPALNNVHVPGSRRQVIYTQIGLADRCRDSITQYEFNTKANRYIFRKSICDNVDTELFTYDDVGLLIFRSISKTVAPGFNLTFTNFEGN